MSLSHTGWTSSVFRRAATTLAPPPASGGTTQPGAAPNTPSNLLAGNTSGNPVGDAALHSRQYMNPLAGNRQTVATGSVYAQPNVPAYLAEAVNNLNAEQQQRKVALTSFQNQLLDMYKAAGQQFNPDSSTYADPTPSIRGIGGNENQIWSAAKQQSQIGAALQTLALQPGTHLSLGTGWVS